MTEISPHQAFADAFLSERYADVRPREGGGWTALCPLCDGDARFGVTREMIIGPCPNGHSGGEIEDWTGHGKPYELPPELAARKVTLTVRVLRTDPPQRRYLLHDANTGDGVFVAGKVGLFAAEGGAGKSWSLAQLAVAVATGTTWFGARGWVPSAPGRVLWLSAEEDEEEILRRVHFAVRQQSAVGDADLAAVCANIDVFDLVGVGVALTGKDDGTGALPETKAAVTFREMIRASAYALVILDPLSRFAGFDVEKDNAAATRFIQVVETFDTSTMIAHHLKKRGENDDPESADPIRGASALKDGVRWAARLEQEKHVEGSADLLTLRIVKRNGIPPRPPLILCRPNDGNEGALRVATRDEIASHEGVSRRQTRADAKLDGFCTVVLEHIAEGEITPTEDLVKACGKNRSGTLAAMRRLCSEGILERPRKGFIARGSSGSSAVLEPEKVLGSGVPSPRRGRNLEPEPNLVPGTAVLVPELEPEERTP